MATVVQVSAPLSWTKREPKEAPPAGFGTLRGGGNANVAARSISPAGTRAARRLPAKGREETAVRPNQRPEDCTDEQLVIRTRDGDDLAFELLVRKYQSRIIQLVKRLVGEADAADVAQETFIKAYRAIPGFRMQSTFYTWLYRIATNTAKNHIVSRLRRPANHDIDITEAEHYCPDAQLSDITTPESLLLSEEIKQKVAEVIQGLPPELRRAITLRELEGLSYEEIAEVMHCPIGTVRSRIFRARETIDVVMQPLLGA